MTGRHQPGESVFRSILPEEIEWKPFPAFPPEARLAVGGRGRRFALDHQAVSVWSKTPAR